MHCKVNFILQSDVKQSLWFYFHFLRAHKHMIIFPRFLPVLSGALSSNSMIGNAIFCEGYLEPVIYTPQVILCLDENRYSSWMTRCQYVLRHLLRQHQAFLSRWTFTSWTILQTLCIFEASVFQYIKWIGMSFWNFTLERAIRTTRAAFSPFLFLFCTFFMRNIKLRHVWHTSFYQSCVALISVQSEI